MPTVNERNNHPVDYCKLYRTRYLARRGNNLAAGAKVTFGEAPSGNYGELGKTALTDGLYGGTTFVESWVGWEGKNAEFVVDLGTYAMTAKESVYLECKIECRASGRHSLYLALGGEDEDFGRE